MPGTIDETDIKILEALQDNGRMTNVDLAARVGLTAPPCLRRVRSLEERGYIGSYHAHLDPIALGYTTTVFAMVSLKSQAEEDLQAFEAHVAQLPEVRECHMLAGETDFLLKIVAHDWDSYQRFLTTNLTAAPNVSHVKSALAIRTAKQEPGVPIDVEGGAEPAAEE